MVQKLDSDDCARPFRRRLSRFPDNRWYTKLAAVLYEKIIGNREREARKLLRNNPEEFVQLMFPNPVIAAQARGELVFEPDYYLGHTLPAEKDFIGSDRFVSLNETINEIKITGKRVVLNTGDSSTSGWDGGVMAINRERRARGEEILLPFFRYKTYSDCLREFAGDEFIIVNAGVPAHTSVHGARRLRLLLEAFKEAGVHIDYVTTYYGNNDSSWNGNKRDKDLLPLDKSGVFEIIRESLFERFMQFRLSLARRFNLKAQRGVQKDALITRTSIEDYETYMKQIISLCVRFKTVPILLEPQTPLYWEPGKRVKCEELADVSDLPGGQLTYLLLKRARMIWSLIVPHEFSESKIEILKQIRELDYVIPRIKEAFLNALKCVGHSTRTPFVAVDFDRKGDDIHYFYDYCHPSEDANRVIANAILKEIRRCDAKGINSILKSIRIVVEPHLNGKRPIDTSPVDTYMYPLW